jgi:Reverse transcriptase (RNA-dependent DNA polymerase)
LLCLDLIESSAPGPNSFSSFSINIFWTCQIWLDVIVATLSLKLFTRLNHAMVCLMPKEKEAKVIQKYMLISLVDCCFKIIWKFLTNRLAPLMHSLVDHSQYVFIKGRYILDNVLAANEIIHATKQAKQSGVVLKVNFEKTYDRVNWEIIWEILLSRGLGLLWTNWIMNLLQSAQTCVNINGSSAQYFFCKQGLRQGDPFSPFLFDLVTDSLCQILARGKQFDHIQGLGPVLEDGFLCTHFLYVDDTIFLKADFKNIDVVLWALYVFEALSGIKINYSKNETDTYQLGTYITQTLATMIGCKLNYFSISYLGIDAVFMVYLIIKF